MPRESLIRPVGIVSQPNKVGVYPAGALQRADNCVMRSPGTLEQIRQTTQYIAGSEAAGGSVHRLFATGSQLLKISRTSGGTWAIIWVQSGLSNAATLSVGTLDLNVNGRIDAVQLRGRTFITTENGVYVNDFVNPSSAAERQFRPAGLPGSGFCQVSTLAAVASGRFNIARTTLVGYAVLVVRTFADGYVLTSAFMPAAGVVVTDAADYNAVAISLVAPDADADFRSTDALEVYKSDPVTYAAASPQSASQRMFLIAALSGISGSVIDKSASTWGLGKDHYANPGQKGLDGTKQPPPKAACLAVYKNRLFCGNITTPAYWKVSVPGGISVGINGGGPAEQLTGLERANGIGIRQVTGTATIGNPTITGVSAADIIGIVPGQRVISNTGRIPALATVSAVGATTITFSQNAASSGATTDTLSDVVELNGALYQFPNLAQFLFEVSGTLTARSPRFYTSYITIRPTGWIVDNERELFLETVRYFSSASFTIRGTNGQNYAPVIPEISATAQTFTRENEKNGIAWSNEDEPEAFPPLNYGWIGRGEIYAMRGTRDAIYTFASDGLWRTTGANPPFESDNFDPTLILAGPQALCVLREAVWAYTNRGFVVVDGGGVSELSEGVIGDVLPGAQWSETRNVFLEADEDNEEIWIGIRTGSVTEFYIYNLSQQSFTKWITQPDVTAITYARNLGGLAVGLSPGSGSIGEVRRFDPATTTFEAATVDFQPTMAGDPMSTKQWIDMAVAFDAASVGKSVTSRFNAVDSVANLCKAAENDCRVNFGVPRSAPAIGNTLAPGFKMPAGTGGMKLSTLSLRFEAHGEQKYRR